MMMLLVCVLAAFLLTGNAQDCDQLPKLGVNACCTGVTPASLTTAAMKDCGLKKDPAATGLPTCDVSICTLKNANVLGADGKLVDKDAFIAAVVGPQYPLDLKTLLGPAYDACKESMDKPADKCGQFGFIMCFKSQLLKNCPVTATISSQECTNTKAHYDKCFSKP